MIRTNLIRQDANQLVKGCAPISVQFIYEHRDFKTIPLGIDPKYDRYHINEIMAYLKILVTDQPHSLDCYAQPELELDDMPNMQTRDFGFNSGRDSVPEQTDWFVFSSRFRVIGPKKSLLLQDSVETDFKAFTVKVPNGFSAMGFAATADDIQKDLCIIQQSQLQRTNISCRDSMNPASPAFPPGKSFKSTKSIQPPRSAFGAAYTLDKPFPAGVNGAANNSIQVLELVANEPNRNLELIKGQEIILLPKTSIDSGETILPFGYDEVNDLYFPIGYTDSQGIVHIEQLPMPTSGLIQDLDYFVNDKSISGSIKLFFQKVAWSPLSGIKNLSKLTLHERGEDGATTQIDYCSSDKSEATPASIAQKIGTGDALLLIHGIVGDTKTMVETVLASQAMHGQFSGVLSYDYENLNTSIEETAKNLKRQLEACGFGNGKRLTIISHSMGGLVSRYLIEHLGGDRFVKKLIQCGTPNAGSELSDFIRKITGWLFGGLNGVAVFQPYMAVAAFLGRRFGKAIFISLEQMDPSSSFIGKLNTPLKTKPNVLYYLLGGDTSQILGKPSSEVSEWKNRLVQLSTQAIYTGLDFAVFDNEPNDMAVKIASMQHLPWGQHDDSAIVHCDHINYFLDSTSLDTLKRWIQL